MIFYQWICHGLMILELQLFFVPIAEGMVYLWVNIWCDVIETKTYDIQICLFEKYSHQILLLVMKQPVPKAC